MPRPSGVISHNYEHETASPQQRETRLPKEPPASITLRDNTVFIGKKNVMSYVLAVVSQFNAGSKEVKVKARGRTVASAVDVSQIVKNRFVPDLKISLEDISTEELSSENGRKSKVSSLTLLLSK
ncbi:DNA-binding protein Alba [Candidatus Micrarchaeota archaeon]|nr:DNA-binding protein Alba [Candidatus Micrarchaeota archaeon]